MKTLLIQYYYTFTWMYTILRNIYPIQTVSCNACRVNLSQIWHLNFSLNIAPIPPTKDEKLFIFIIFPPNIFFAALLITRGISLSSYNNHKCFNNIITKQTISVEKYRNAEKLRKYLLFLLLPKNIQFFSINDTFMRKILSILTKKLLTLGKFWLKKKTKTKHCMLV